MQYGELITRSFAIAWRRRYLWLLAMLGGADVTSGGGFNFSGVGNAFSGGGSSSGTSAPASGSPASPASLQDAANALGGFLQDNLLTIVLVGVILLVVAVAWWLLSCVTTGALVRATAEHDAERPFGLGLAWRTGLGTFWPILGLRLIGLLWTIVVLGSIAGAVLLGISAYLSNQAAALGAVIAVGLLVGAVLVLASIPVGIAFILATRAAVLEQRGPLSALGRGFGLVWSRIGRVLLVWLLQVGLALAAGLGLAFVLIPVVLLLVAVVVAAGIAGGPGASVVVAIPMALLLFAVFLVVGAVVATYLSAYWTLAFRRMEIDAPRPVAWPQAPYGPPRAG
jgi:hypothetical protein